MTMITSHATHFVLYNPLSRTYFKRKSRWGSAIHVTSNVADAETYPDLAAAEGTLATLPTNATFIALAPAQSRTEGYFIIYKSPYIKPIAKHSYHGISSVTPLGIARFRADYLLFPTRASAVAVIRQIRDQLGSTATLELHKGDPFELALTKSLVETYHAGASDA